MEIFVLVNLYTSNFHFRRIMGPLRAVRTIILVAAVLHLTAGSGSLANSRHGGIIQETGTMSMVADIIAVKFSTIDLRVLLPIITTSVTSIRNTESMLNKYVNFSAIQHNEHYNLLTQLQWKINIVKDTLSYIFIQINTKIPEKPKSKSKPSKRRPKRGLIDAGGYILHSLFGTATSSEVNAVSDKLGAVENALRNQDRLVEIQIDKINEISTHVNNLQTLLTNTESAINKLENITSFLENILEIESHLDNIYIITMKLESDYTRLLNALSEAEHGIVNINLLPLNILRKIITNAEADFNLLPLFPMTQLELLYGYIDVHMYADRYMVLIPFASIISFTHYKITPFPFYLNNQLVSLDNTLDNLFISNTENHHAWMDDYSFATFCHSPINSQAICPAFTLKLIPSLADSCPSALIHNTSVINHCQFKDVPKKPFYHAHNSHAHHLYFPSDTSITITCGKDIPSSDQVVSGLIVIPDSCTIVTSKVTFYPTNYHYTVAAQSFKMRDMFLTLPNISANISILHINSPHMDTLQLINKSILPMNFVKYYHPYFAIPVIGSPILILIIMLCISYLALYRMNLRILAIENHVRH